jgi:hypothetical protein
MNEQADVRVSKYVHARDVCEASLKWNNKKNGKAQQKFEFPCNSL